MSEIDALRKSLAREQAARREAEASLEEKSREVDRAVLQIRKLTTQNKAISETAVEGIISYDSEGTILSLNKAAERMFQSVARLNCNVEDLFEKQEGIWKKLFPEPDQEEACPSDDEQDQEIVSLVGLRSNSETFVAEARTSVIADGPALLYTVALRDISQRRLLESRLSQVQKMESVGQLAAGLSHEINTPIQFIGNNLQFLEGAFDDLGALLDLYARLVESVEGGESPAALLEEISQQSELADLPFLREEFPGAMAQINEGVEQVATIVRAMKEFSQPSSGEKKAIDINRAIENAVAVSNYNYRGVAAVDLNLEPNLRHVPCLNAEINQALLNILCNSAEAIAESPTQGEGRIGVSTRTVGGEVEIRFEDNGPGIPEAVQSKIFDPFFTTKEVGKGTGQGLAFVYDVVVNKHEGSIYAVSPPEGGATFVVRLPFAVVGAGESVVAKQKQRMSAPR